MIPHTPTLAAPLPALQRGKAASMAARTRDPFGFSLGSKRPTTSPRAFTKNLVKFQRTSPRIPSAVSSVSVL